MFIICILLLYAAGDYTLFFGGVDLTTTGSKSIRPSVAVAVAIVTKKQIYWFSSPRDSYLLHAWQVSNLLRQIQLGHLVQGTSTAELAPRYGDKSAGH
jgi:nicotinic acid phosphoribosyltransferase